MAKVMRCPECGSDEDQISLLKDGTRYYEAELTHDGMVLAGLSYDFEEEEGSDRLACTRCGFESRTTGMFVREESNGDDQ